MSQLPKRIRSLPCRRMIQEKTGQSLLQNCYIAREFRARFFGLMGVEALPSTDGLLLEPCKDIHMGFMRLPIDAIFLRRLESRENLSGRYEVTSIQEGLRPWRFLPARDGSATSTLEVQSGLATRLKLRPGDILLCSS
jgi:uncharacterized membrane protein (UPF0127 family)